MASFTTPQRHETGNHATKSMGWTRALFAEPSTSGIEPISTPTRTPRHEKRSYEPDPFFQEVEARFDAGRHRSPCFQPGSPSPRKRSSPFASTRSIRSPPPPTPAPTPTEKTSGFARTEASAGDGFFHDFGNRFDDGRTPYYAKSLSIQHGTSSAFRRVRPVQSPPTATGTGLPTSTTTDVAAAVTKSLQRAASPSIEEAFPVPRNKRPNRYKQQEAESFIATLREHQRKKRTLGPGTPGVPPVDELVKRLGIASTDRTGLLRDPAKRARVGLPLSQQEPNEGWRVPQKTVRFREEEKQQHQQQHLAPETFVDVSAGISCKRRKTHQSHDQRRIRFGLRGCEGSSSSPYSFSPTRPPKRPRPPSPQRYKRRR